MCRKINMHVFFVLMGIFLTDDEKSGLNLECKRDYSTDKDFLVGKVGDQKKVSGKQHSKLILSCFRKQ